MKQKQERNGSFRATLVLVALWLVPILAWVGFSSGGQLLERISLSPTPPQVVQVGERLNDGRQGIDVLISQGKSPTISTNSTGLVTAINMELGQEINPGDPVFTVEGNPKLAYQGPTPFYRELRVGDQGPDVSSLLLLLNSAELLTDDASRQDVFTHEAHLALAMLQERYGQRTDGVLHPSDFVFVPANFGRTISINVDVGSQLSGEEVLAEGSRKATEIFFTAIGKNEPIVFPGPGLQLGAGEEEIEVSSTTVSDEELTYVHNSLQQWLAAGLVRAVDDEDMVQRVSGTTLRLAEAEHIGTVPATSVMTDSKGNSCVVVVDSSGSESAHKTALNSVSGGVGLSGVDPGLIGLEVLRDVTERRDEARACPS